MWIITAFLLIGVRSLKFSFGKITTKLCSLTVLKWPNFSVHGVVFMLSSVLFLNSANLVKAEVTLEVYGVEIFDLHLFLFVLVPWTCFGEESFWY